MSPALNVTFMNIPKAARNSASNQYCGNTKNTMKLDKIISTILVILIILGVSAVVYIVVNPQPNEKFTELYILGENGKAGNYPINMIKVWDVPMKVK